MIVLAAGAPVQSNPQIQRTIAGGIVEGVGVRESWQIDADHGRRSGNGVSSSVGLTVTNWPSTWTANLKPGVDKPCWTPTPVTLRVISDEWKW